LGYIFATKARIDNREKLLKQQYLPNQKKIVKQQYVLQMSPQYGELWPTNG